MAHARVDTDLGQRVHGPLLEHAGIEVTVVAGAAGNLKITRPDDLPVAAALLQRDPTPFRRP